MAQVEAGDDLVTGVLTAADVVHGVPVVPAEAVLTAVAEAARQVGAVAVGELTHLRPIVVPDGRQVEWRMTVDAHRGYMLFVRRGEEWVPHATGELVDDPCWDGQDGFADALTWPVATLADLVRRDNLTPVRWRGVELRPGAVRARATWDGLRGRVWLADADGRPTGYLDEVLLGPPDVDTIRAEPVPHVFRLAHHEIAPTLSAGPRTIVDLTGVRYPEMAAAEALSAAHRHTGDRPLVFLVNESLACAPVHGLVRSLRLERPEWTVRLVERRADAASTAVTAALDADAPELVVAGTALLAPRLEPAVIPGGQPVLDPDGTVLITGGTGELGRLLAAHLVTTHGIRHLLLVSRRGRDTAGAAALDASLRSAGAQTVQLVAADVADRGQVTAALATVAPAHPLTAVFHLAGVADGRMIAAQDETRLRRVLAPKVAGAWHLHELTRDEPLTAFVLFSSVASVFGAAGHANYAAACSYLDALATRRRANGQVATSVSWGPWEQHDTGLNAHLDDTETARLRRNGIGVLDARQACRILDAALAQPTAHLVAAVRTPGETPAGDVRQLAELAGEQRWRAVVALVHREVEVVLGAPVGQRQILGDAGVDSLLALELRTRLTAVTGVPLPATLVVDHPTPHAVARLIVSRLAPARTEEPTVAVLGAARDGVVAALEHAGILPESLRGKRVGVYLTAVRDRAVEVAREYGLLGPAVTLWGSPLTAVHLARVALLRGECDLALAGDDGIVVLSTVEQGRAVLTASTLAGAGADGMAELIAAVRTRRWAEVQGSGARVTVEPTPVRPVVDVPGPWPVVISGRDRTELLSTAARWANWLTTHQDVPLAAVARTAALHRTQWGLRACVVASSAVEAANALRRLANGAEAGERDRLVYSCQVHAGRWTGLGRALLTDGPFARAASECEAVLRPLTGWSVLDALSGEHDLDLDRQDVIQPTAFTAQVSLAAALRDLGLVPDTAYGTAAAAVITGETPLAEAAKLVVAEAAARLGTADSRDVIVPLHPVRTHADVLRIIGDVHVRGYPVDWARVLPEVAPVDLGCAE